MSKTVRNMPTNLRYAKVYWLSDEQVEGEDTRFEWKEFVNGAEALNFAHKLVKDGKDVRVYDVQESLRVEMNGKK